MEIYVKDNKALSLDGKLLSPAASGETWVLNNVVKVDSKGFNLIVYTPFISNDKEYLSIKIQASGQPEFEIGGFTAIVSYDSNFVHDVSNWTNQAYRTITFLEPVTNADLLTWLQTNGTKQ